jgi:hypothetical protein
MFSIIFLNFFYVNMKNYFLVMRLSFLILEGAREENKKL